MNSEGAWTRAILSRESKPWMRSGPRKGTTVPATSDAEVREVKGTYGDGVYTRTFAATPWVKPA